MRYLLGVALVVLVGCRPAVEQPADDTAATQRATPGPAGSVYTTDEDGDSVTRVDLATGEATRIDVPISPHNLQISEDGALLLVTGPLADAHAHGDAHDEAAGRGGRLLVLDAESMELYPPVIEAGEHPAHVVLDSQNRLAYVTDSGSDSVRVIDLETARPIDSIATCAYPHGLRMSPDERELYVACVDDDAVSVIDVATRQESARVPVGRAPVQVGVTADGQRVYVTLRDEDAVAVIDATARTVVQRIPVGRGPIQLFATPDSRAVYVANEGTPEQPDSTVSVIDTAAGEVVATVTTGAGPHGVVVTDDGRYALITNAFANTVSVIDTAEQRVVDAVAVGEGPTGITYRRE